MNNMIAEIQEPFDIVFFDFARVNTISINTRAPDKSRRMVNKAGPISVSFKAIRQMIEFPAKAIKARSVRSEVLVK